jgi:hypothetical protein
MRKAVKVSVVVCLVGMSFWLTAASAHAQFRNLIGANTVAIKNGETLELGEIYWVSHCRSLLKETPTVEVLEGPPQVSATIKEAMVLPRGQSCAKKVNGGMLTLSAKDVDDPSFTRLTLRILYKTRDGDRKYSHIVNLQLVP